MDEKAIEKQAKEIMDKFFSALSKLPEQKKQEADKEESLRDVAKAECSPEFRQAFFNIAIKRSDDYFIVEKAKWKQ